MNKKITKKVLIVLLLFVILSLSALFIVKTISNKDVIFYVNDYPIYKQEVQIIAKDLKMSQRQSFAEKSNQDLENLDFSKNVEGKTGYEYYAQAVIDKLVRIKVIQIDAKENGLYKNIDFKDIQKELKQNNQNRAEDKSENKVVYGLVQYDEEEYYDYVNTNLYIQNQRYLEKTGVLTTTEEEKKAKYNEDPTKFDSNPYEEVHTFVANVVLTEKYENYINSLIDKAKLKDDENVLKFIKELV